MKILFHANELCYRGTTVALYDYALANEQLLGNQSIIAHNINGADNSDTDGQSDYKVLERFKNNFEVVSYDNFNELNIYSKENNIDAAYFIKSGQNDGKIITGSTKNLIHSVFQYYEPHGDVYAYVSEWLSESVTGGKMPWIPHVVNMPEPESGFREEFRKSLGIDDRIVVGRYGGLTTFDQPWVHETLVELADEHPEFFFIFVNTYQFTNHQSFFFIDSIIDLQAKSNYISVTDAMIHARSHGESFGNALCEFMFHNKPVFSWAGGHDGNHRVLLSGKESLFLDKEDLVEKLILLKNGYDFGNYRDIVESFSPEKVMKKFKEVYLD